MGRGRGNAALTLVNRPSRRPLACAASCFCSALNPELKGRLFTELLHQAAPRENVGFQLHPSLSVAIYIPARETLGYDYGPAGGELRFILSLVT